MRCWSMSASANSPITAPGICAYGHQRRLEIARALATEPRLLALDEPAAGMNAGEKWRCASCCCAFATAANALLLIEHDVKLVMGLCDRLTVLDYGKAIAEGEPAWFGVNRRSFRPIWGGAHV